MIKLTLFLTLFISFNSIAAKKSILVCLGNEEFKFHKKKYTGPLYKLNKTLISNMIQLNKSAQIKNQHLTKICESKSPSLQFLKILLKKGKIFKINNSGNDLADNMAKGSIEILRQNSPQIFLDFLSYIKSISPSPFCLEKQVPEIEELFNTIRYLEKEYSLTKIIHTDNRITKIFKKIQNWDALIKKCYKDLKKLKKKKSSKE